LLKLIDQEPNC
jgi:hypothetical protein